MTTTVNRSLRQRAQRDVAVQVFARALNLLLGAFVTAVLARSLGESGFGEWSTIFVLNSMIGFLMELGLTAVAVREAAGDPERAGEWVCALLFVQLALSIPSGLAALLVISLVNESREMMVAAFVLFLTFPLGAAGALGVVFRIQMRNGIPMLMLTINSIAWAAAIVIVDRTGGGMVDLAIAMVAITTVINTVTGYLALRRIKLKRPSRAVVRRLIAVGSAVGVSGMLIVSYARIDQFLVFTIAGSKDAGYYSAAYRLLDSSAMIPVSVLTTLAPVLAASWPRDRQRLLSVSKQALEYLTAGSLGALAFTIVASDSLVNLLFGPGFEPAATAMPVLTAAFVFISYGYLTDNLMLVLGLQRKMILVAFSGLAVNVVANLILIPPHGFMGAAWATLGTEIVVELVAAAFVLRKLGIRRPRPGRLLNIVAAAALLTVLLWVLDSAGAPFSAQIFATAVAYPVLLLTIGGLRLEEFSGILRRRPAT